MGENIYASVARRVSPIRGNIKETNAEFWRETDPIWTKWLVQVSGAAESLHTAEMY